nr:hypothetical protein [Mycoplasmopsis bovis]
MHIRDWNNDHSRSSKVELLLLWKSFLEKFDKRFYWTTELAR